MYDVDGGAAVQVDGAGFLAADEGHVLLAPAQAHVSAAASSSWTSTG